MSNMFEDKRKKNEASYLNLSIEELEKRKMEVGIEGIEFTLSGLSKLVQEKQLIEAGIMANISAINDKKFGTLLDAETCHLDSCLSFCVSIEIYEKQIKKLLDQAIKLRNEIYDLQEEISIKEDLIIDIEENKENK